MYFPPLIGIILDPLNAGDAVEIKRKRFKRQKPTPAILFIDFSLKK